MNVFFSVRTCHYNQSPERAAYAGFMFEGALGLVEEPLDSVLLQVGGHGERTKKQIGHFFS